MISKELLDFIEQVNKILSKKYGQDYNKREHVMARTIKMTEEVGELCSEVLAGLGDQRERINKDKHSLEHLKGEFADVLITTLLLAETMGVDINASLETKIDKINKRYETAIK